MNTSLKTILIMALVLAFSTNIDAQRRYNFPGQQQGPNFNQMGQVDNFEYYRGVPQQRMIALLNLSEEQLEQVQEHWLNGQKEMLPLRNQLQEKNARLQTLTTSANYDEKAVNALVKEIGDLQNQILANRVAHRQEMRNLLTDEQRITFDSLQSRKGPGMRAGGRSGYNNFRGFRR